MAHPPDQSLARAIAEVLSEARDRGMTTSDIADYFGVSDPTVTRWEAGARQPALDLLPSFDRLAGRERGYILRLAGYVTDPPAADESRYKINKNDPYEVALWDKMHIPEPTRWELILQYREINAEPPPPPPAKKRAPRPARVRKSA